jgi:quercetin dioxygenase-like cupin family protein
MTDTTVTKIDSSHSPTGTMGQKYLASGIHVAMRLWEQEPGDGKPERTREYETVGYAIAGKAELHLEGQTVLLKAVEATSPPAHAHARDEE